MSWYCVFFPISWGHSSSYRVLLKMLFIIAVQVSSVPGPASRQYGDVQRQVLHFLRPAAGIVPGCPGFLPLPGRHPGWREQPGAARLHQLGTLEATPVSLRFVFFKQCFWQYKLLAFCAVLSFLIYFCWWIILGVVYLVSVVCYLVSLHLILPTYIYEIPSTQINEHQLLKLI